jgi:hypothetical protein
MARGRTAAWIVPATAALAYPLVFLLATGAANRPLRAALSLLVPTAGIVVLCVLDRMVPPEDRRRSAFWAGLALVAPAVLVIAHVLLPRLGLPIEAVRTVWRSLALPVVALIGLVLRSRPARPAGPAARHGAVLTAHRVSAVILAAFAVAHLLNHATALWSIALNRAILDALRIVYRSRVLEPILVAAVAVQVLTGFMMLPSALKRPGLAHRLQAYSGLCFLLFVSIHTFALVFIVRNDPQLSTTDLDFFVASGGPAGSLGSEFLPYYLLGPVSFVTHAACAARRLVARRPRLGARLARLVAAVGLLVCLAITLALLGVSVTGDRTTAEPRAITRH